MNEYVDRGQLTHHLGGALRSGGLGLDTVPSLIQQAIESHAWEQRIIVETGQEFEGFPTFAAYVVAAPPKGLGSKTEVIERLLITDPDTLRKFRQAITGKRGRPPKNSDNITIIKTERGTSKAYGLDRLHRERPDLYERVVAGEMRTHAAMVEAGFRKSSEKGSWADVAELLSRVVDRLNDLEKRVEDLERKSSE